MPIPMRLRAELALAAVTIVWGWTFVAVKNALDQTSTLLFLALRFGVASIALALMFRGRFGLYPNYRRDTLRAGLLAGACLFLGYLTQTAGLRYTTPAKSAFLTGLSAALVPFLAAIVYRKAPHSSEILGVAVATAGMALFTLSPGRLRLGYGDTLTLCCAIAFACHILVIGHWAARTSFELLTFSQISVVALLALAVCGWAEPVRIEWTAGLAVALLLTGVAATAIAFSVQSWAQRHTSPTRAALIFALEPVSAAVCSYFLAGEVLSTRGLAGAIMILAGVLVVELKPIGAREHPLA